MKVDVLDGEVVLTYAERRAVLAQFQGLTIETLQYNAELNSAVQKLMGYVRVPAVDLPAGLHPILVHSFRMNDKIDTIKLIRHLSGWGLKEAKDFFDRSHEVVDGKYVVSLQLRKTSEEVHRIVSAAGGYYISGG